jgi:GAF domain-containing protein
MPENGDVARALAEASRMLHVPASLEETLDTIVKAALASVPGFDHVGVSIVHRNGKIETVAATGQLVWELDTLQYELGEGPCVSALREDPVVVAENIRHDQRWPRYVPQAVELGVRAQAGFQLYVEEETLGGLNFYSTQTDEIDPHALTIGELFGTHAALALGRARRESQLNEAIGTRSIIGTAIGLVMERYQLSHDRAFQFLVRASSTSNIKLRDIAQEVVEQADQRGGAQTGPASPKLPPEAGNGA